MEPGVAVAEPACAASVRPAATRRRRELVAIIGLALLAWCVIGLVRPGMSPAAVARLCGWAYSAAGALFVTAGALQFARARLTGDPRLTWSAAALLVVGPALLIAATLTPPSSGQAGPFPSPAGRLVVAVPALAVLLVGTRRTAGRHAPSLVRIVAVTLLVEFVAGLALARSATGTRVPTPTWVLTGAVASVLWVVIALRVFGQVRTRARRYNGWRALALGLMATGEALYAPAVAGASRLGTLAAGCQLVAAGIVVVAASAGLREAFVAQSNRMLRLADELGAAERRIAVLEDAQRERLHDARNAMVGVLGAAQLFSVPAGTGAGASVDLHRVVSAEMHRLASLLDPEADEGMSDFALAEAFEPVLVAYRSTGMAISVDLRDLRVYGRATVTATVLANLLANSAKHAPGSPVVVRAASAGAMVRICVEDNGPGIPAGERKLLLMRGQRSSTAQGRGTGLGLYTAALAMAGQGGALRAEGRDGLCGTRIVLSMPAAITTPVAPLRASVS